MGFFSAIKKIFGAPKDEASSELKHAEEQTLEPKEAASSQTEDIAPSKQEQEVRGQAGEQQQGQSEPTYELTQPATPKRSPEQEPAKEADEPHKATEDVDERLVEQASESTPQVELGADKVSPLAEDEACRKELETLQGKPTQEQPQAQAEQESTQSHAQEQSDIATAVADSAQEKISQEEKQEEQAAEQAKEQVVSVESEEPVVLELVELTELHADSSEHVEGIVELTSPVTEERATAAESAACVPSAQEESAVESAAPSSEVVLELVTPEVSQGEVIVELTVPMAEESGTPGDSEKSEEAVSATQESLADTLEKVEPEAVTVAAPVQAESATAAESAAGVSAAQEECTVESAAPSSEVVLELVTPEASQGEVIVELTVPMAEESGTISDSEKSEEAVSATQESLEDSLEKATPEDVDRVGVVSTQAESTVESEPAATGVSVQEESVTEPETVVASQEPVLELVAPTSSQDEAVVELATPITEEAEQVLKVSKTVEGSEERASQEQPEIVHPQQETAESGAEPEAIVLEIVEPVAGQGESVSSQQEAHVELITPEHASSMPPSEASAVVELVEVIAPETPAAEAVPEQEKSDLAPQEEGSQAVEEPKEEVFELGAELIVQGEEAEPAVTLVESAAAAAAVTSAAVAEKDLHESALYQDLTRRLRDAEPKLSAWLDIVLDGVTSAGEELNNRVRFLLRALEAPEDEAEVFVQDFAGWLDRMEYYAIDEFRSELQYRLSLALDLEDEEDERSRLFLKLSQSLAKTREQFAKHLEGLFASHGELDDDFWDELEELFIMADLGVDSAIALTQRLKERARREKVTTSEGARELLREEIKAIFTKPRHIVGVTPPEVVLMIGVNGAGKTTTIAKLAYRDRMQGKKVMIAAADTFRAAAIDQMRVWAERVGTLFYAKDPGSDPASVAWEAMDRALAEKVDVLYVDTAGRLQTKVNLMDELSKIRQVIAKKHPGSPHRTVLVLDATTGQNALSQAKLFKESAGVDELILTKLDGTAKGGVAIAVAMQYALPISYVGLGEKVGDLRPFNGDDYADALLASV